MQHKRIRLPMAVIALLWLLPTGCATIVNDRMVSIFFNTSHGKPAQCEVSNGNGQWRFSIPGTHAVARDRQPLRIRCVDEAGSTGSLTLQYKIAPASWWNLLPSIGGLGVALECRDDVVATRYAVRRGCSDDDRNTAIGLATVGLVASLVDTFSDKAQTYDQQVVVQFASSK